MTVVEPTSAFELASPVYVPFEPKAPEAFALRARLREGIRRLVGSEQTILHATFSGPRRKGSDVENALLFNVDSSGGSFMPAGSRGVRFELSARTTPDCVYRYELAPRSSGFKSWTQDAELARFERVALPRRPSDRQEVWWALQNAAGEMRERVHDAGSPFSVSIEVHPPGPVNAGLPRLVKPLIDGIVCALQCHSDVASLDSVSARVARALKQAPEDVAKLLCRRERAVLGTVPLLVRPWGQTVQWNPADEQCVAAEILLGPSVGAQWAVSCTVHDVVRASTEA